MKRTFVVAGIAAALTLAGAAWGGGWVVETITGVDNGKGCSLVVDAQDNPHVAYIDQSGREDNVMYATKKNDVWSYDMARMNVAVVGETAITVDGHGFPYILHCTGALLCLYKDLEGWHLEGVANATTTNASFAPWPYGYGEASYSVSSGSAGTYLGYAIKETAPPWTSERVTPTYDMGSGANTLLVDASKKRHIIFADLISKKVMHATQETSGWAFEEVDGGTDCCAYLTPDGKIHVSYTKIDNTALKYAVYDDDEWTIETVDKAKGLPGLTQICVNYEGTVFVSYFNWEMTNLHVATKDKGSWSDKLVMAGKGQGYPHAMAIGNEQYPQLLFYNANLRRLRYATYDPTLDVELTKFTAERSRAGVDVRWAARGDGGVAGYNLFRAAEGRERERVNPSLIAGFSPFLYRDARAENDVAYDYWLELIPLHGKSRTFGPASLPPSGSARAFALFQNAPNPVSSATTFTFELAEGADVRLAVYDAAGRRVAVPAEGYFGPGRHDVPFACGLAPGVYVYRVEAGANVAARKMVVLK